MKIHIPKHINFAPDSYMYKAFFFPILYNCFVPSGKALGFSEQRDGKKEQAWNLRKNWEWGFATIRLKQNKQINL